MAGFCAAVSAAAMAPAAATAAAGPGWELTARSYPTVFSPTPAVSPSVSGTIGVDVVNVGAGSSSGQITVTDTLPPGVLAVEAGDGSPGNGVKPLIGHSDWACTGNGKGSPPNIVGASVVTCVSAPGLRFDGGGGAPTSNNPSLSHPQPIVEIAVDVQPGFTAHEVNHVVIAGGGAPVPASTEDPITISSTLPSFETVGWDGWFSNADGTLDTQAGSHPYEATFTFDLATATISGSSSEHVTGGEMRNIEVQLPPGFVGNPTAVPQCTRQQFQSEVCPGATEIGTAMFYFAGFPPDGLEVFNLVPPPGVPAEFGFTLAGINTFMDAGVRSGSNYGITEHVNNIAQKEPVHVVTTLWGNPADPTHDKWRNGQPGGCSAEDEKEFNKHCRPVSGPERPFLTLPTACEGPQPFVIKATSWTGNTSEKTFFSHDASGVGTGWTGCQSLGFAPLVTIAPDTAKADTPAGLTVEVKPPLGALEALEGLGTSDIQNTTVQLPAGFVINPGQAAGLQACQHAQAHVGDGNDGPAECPNASKVGTVEIKSPLIEGAAEKEFKGDVFVLQSNPPNIELLVAASADGVNLKLVGKASLCEHAGEELAGKTCQAPGQIITTFLGTPELPFSVFKLSFSGGAQAALDTPAQCGTYTTNADFGPWAHPFVEDFNTTAAFGITEGPNGTGCPSDPMPFSPSMVAGSTTDQAGAFTNFSLLLQRADGQQRIEKLQFREPAGLAGLISSVPLCDEANANAGTCPAGSHIGHAVVTSGPGPYPLVLPQPGAPELPIYLTGPYKGAPFGLSIVTPVVAGPFNLGTVVTRAKIEVDPRTAQITITTDPLPQIVHGVPTDLRSINSIIDRPGFLFNPTNCNPQEFTGTAWGTPPPGAAGPGATAPISSHFGVGSCRELKFSPKFAVSTSARTSRANGASLTAKLAYPTGAQGRQANIARVKVDLPKQLPSRLTTLQKACTNAQFELNPANCPAASKIGFAKVITPVLPVPLEGPAIFVSHGGEAFPSLTMVLQGYGVTVDLVGATFISKAGITSTTFKTVPDVPFNTFELKLPQGKFSALAANGNLCKSKLAMPTEFVAQNGLKINQTTKVAVTGCKKKAKKASKHKRGKRGKKK